MSTTSPAQERALALQGRIRASARIGEPPVDGLTLFGLGQSDIMTGFTALEPRARSTVFGIQPRIGFDPEDPSYDLNQRSLSRGVDLVLVTQPRTPRFHPLLTSVTPHARLGPAVFSCVIVDRRIAVLEGPTSPTGDATAWVATSGPFLADTLDMWDATVAESVPALPDGEVPPLNARQLDVARGICLGRTDAAIARQLGISDRTVARDVATILAVVDARSRAEAVLNLLGRGRQSRS